MPHRVLVGVVALATTISGCATTAVGAPDRVVADEALGARIDAVANEAVGQLTMAGMSVAVVRDGELAFAAGYGHADIAAGRPAGARTVYPIGSISKQFTAATVLRLVEAGALDLDDPAAEYVPVPPSDPPPTVRELLSHTSGITDRDLSAALVRTSDGIGMTWEEAVELATAPGYREPPGTGFEYSNGGYLLTYGVVAAAAGQPYRAELEALLEDVGMPDSHVCTGSTDDGTAQGYQQPRSAWARAARLGRPPGLEVASSYNPDLLHVVCATAPDLATWGRRLRTGAVVESASYRLMTERVTLLDGTVVPYGLGLQRRRFGDHQAVAHGGILTGYVAMLADFPDDDTTVALLVNSALGEHETEGLLVRLLAAVLDEPASTRWVQDPPLDRSANEEG